MEITEKYVLKSKAYKIDFDKIHEGMFACERIAYADSIRRAKSILLKGIKNEDYRLIFGEQITYTNIPVVRAKEFDLYEFEGQDLSLSDISGILNERVRITKLNEILQEPTVKFCYIKKHGNYYRPNSCGYTDFVTKAGVYTKEDAISNAKSVKELTIIPIDIPEHNKQLNAEIDDLKTRIII